MDLKKYPLLLALTIIANTTYAMLEKQSFISPKAKRKDERNKFFIVNRLSSPNKPFLCSTEEDVVNDEKTGKSATFIKPVVIDTIQEYVYGLVPHDKVVRQQLYAITATGKHYTIGIMDHRLSRNRKKMFVWHSLPGNLDSASTANIERLTLIDSYNAQATHLTSLDLNTNKTETIELKENM